MASTVQSSESDVVTPHTMAYTPLGFLDLPSEVRNMIYELLLVREGLARPCKLKHYREDPYHFFGLVCTNRSVNREVSSIFYGRNGFDFAIETDLLAAFLQQIGAKNAAYIQHVSINFPVSFNDEFNRVTFDTQAMDTLLNSFVNLNALKAVLVLADDVERILTSGSDEGLALEALNRTNNSFLAFRSLQNITVEVYGHNAILQEIMESYGWTVDVVLSWEDEYWVFSPPGETSGQVYLGPDIHERGLDGDGEEYDCGF